MKISNVIIKNFRSIKNQVFDLNDLSIFIWDNWTWKTSVLEAINYALSPSFLSGRIKFSDFYNWTDEAIEITITFDNNFLVSIPEWFTSHSINCNSIYLHIKKRDRSSPWKAFSDPVVVTHFVIPSFPRWTKGRTIKRKGGTDFNFTERSLTLPVDSDWLVKSFYFWKHREKQIQKWFNTSFGSLIDDLNRQFAKSIRDLTDEEKKEFIKNKNDLENNIKWYIDKRVYDKTINVVNQKLIDFWIKEVDFSFIDEHSPFDNAYLCNNLWWINLPISMLWSGIEIITALIFLETLSALSKENILIIIDEPELHLHPTLQEKLIKYLESISSHTQIILSTHSPYFFKNCLKNKQTELLITKSENWETNITNTTHTPFGLFNRSPSRWEINYIAYNLPTVEFHNELYGVLEEQKKLALLRPTKIRYDDRVHMKKNIDVSLSKYIRHCIHHPENTKNPIYTPTEFEQSIKDMIAII